MGKRVSEMTDAELARSRVARAERYRKNRDRILLQNREYRQRRIVTDEMKQRDSEWHQEYYKKNRDQCRATQREYDARIGNAKRIERRSKNREKYNAWNRQYRKDHPGLHRRRLLMYSKEELKAKQRAATMKHKYGITIEEHEVMLAKQDGACKICRSKTANWKTPSRRDTFCVDHDHATGKVRGLLCVTCNTGLGGFRDSIQNLKSAILYLEEYLPVGVRR